MSVYSYRIISDIEYNVRQVAEMFFARTKLVLSPSEFIAAFINPEHIEKLRDVQELVGFVGQNSMGTTLASTTGSRYSVALTFTGNAPIIIPQYAGQGLQPTCPPDVLAKIVGWLDERTRFGNAFGDVMDAVSMLNEQCGDAAAMRVMLPCLPTIMASLHSSDDDTNTKRAKKVAQAKKFGSLPRLPQSIKQRLLEISAIVNSTALVKDAPEVTAPAQHAIVTVNSPARGEPARPSPLYAGDVTKSARFV